MTTITAMEMSSLPRRQVLAELPERVVKFLRASGAHAGVRAALMAGGYSAADHREGWELLGQVCAFQDDGLTPADDVAARAALSECAAWTATHFGRLRAALEHLHPEALELFTGIEELEPGNAAVALGTFLRRLERLARPENTAAPESAAAPHDTSTVRTLARRGLDDMERARLSRLVESAQRVHRIEGQSNDANGSLHAPRERELLALHRWYSDWSATALAVIGRKDYLIALGLAARRSRAAS